MHDILGWMPHSRACLAGGLPAGVQRCWWPAWQLLQLLPAPCVPPAADARALWLNIASNVVAPGGGTLNVAIPGNRNILPPGM